MIPKWLYNSPMPEAALLRRLAGFSLTAAEFFTACRIILDFCKAIFGRTTTSRRTFRSSSISWIFGPPIWMAHSIGCESPTVS